MPSDLLEDIQGGHPRSAPPVSLAKMETRFSDGLGEGGSACRACTRSPSSCSRCRLRGRRADALLARLPQATHVCSARSQRPCNVHCLCYRSNCPGCPQSELRELLRKLCEIRAHARFVHLHPFAPVLAAGAPCQLKQPRRSSFSPSSAKDPPSPALSSAPSPPHSVRKHPVVAQQQWLPRVRVVSIALQEDFPGNRRPREGL